MAKTVTKDGVEFTKAELEGLLRAGGVYVVAELQPEDMSVVWRKSTDEDEERVFISVRLGDGVVVQFYLHDDYEVLPND